MIRSRKETEVKLPFASAAQARARLEAAGARLVAGRALEDNVLYDREVDPLQPARRMLRLRRFGARSVLTYKAPVSGEHAHKVRLEEETEVGDARALDRILRALGYSPSYRYQKYRTLYEIDDLQACLDETPIGCWVELEGPPASIDRVAAGLGFGSADYVLETYRDLHERAAARAGTDADEMVFEGGAEEPR